MYTHARTQVASSTTTGQHCCGNSSAVSTYTLISGGTWREEEATEREERMAPSMIGAGVRMVLAAVAAKKKARKLYTITRPRERWTADEHDRFLHALHLFGRDWKRIEAFVGTKTAVQIRSHAQKHFLKAHKLGSSLAAYLPPPPPLHPLQQQQPPVAVLTTHASSGAATLPVRSSSVGYSAPSSGRPDAAPPQDEAIGRDDLPLSPEDPRFAQVYRFVGDVFGSGAPRPVEANLWRLQAMDPAVVETILMVLSNLEAKLHA